MRFVIYRPVSRATTYVCVCVWGAHSLARLKFLFVVQGHSCVTNHTHSSNNDDTLTCVGNGKLKRCPPLEKGSATEQRHTLLPNRELNMMKQYS